MSLGEIAICKYVQSRNFLNLEHISIIAICSANVPVLTKDSNRPKSLSTFFFFFFFFECCCFNVLSAGVKSFHENVTA